MASSARLPRRSEGGSAQGRRCGQRGALCWQFHWSKVDRRLGPPPLGAAHARSLVEAGGVASGSCQGDTGQQRNRERSGGRAPAGRRHGGECGAAPAVTMCRWLEKTCGATAQRVSGPGDERRVPKRGWHPAQKRSAAPPCSVGKASRDAILHDPESAPGAAAPPALGQSRRPPPGSPLASQRVKLASIAVWQDARITEGSCALETAPAKRVAVA